MTTTRLVEIAENHGLITPESIDEFFRAGARREIEKVDIEFREALEDSADSTRHIPPGGSNYLASASFRAEQGCVVPECRARRMSEFARFSLLYAERVIFPVYMPEDTDPVWLNGNLRILAEIRPLLDLEIVMPTESHLAMCKECREQFSPVFSQVRDTAWESAARIRVTYLGSKYPESNYRKKKKKNEWAFHFAFPPEFESDIPTLLFVTELHPKLERFTRRKGSKGAAAPCRAGARQ